MKRPLLLLATAVLLCTALLSPLHSAEPKARPGDRDIAFAVENQFLFDKSVPWHAVDAAVTNGAVTLTGKVNNLLDKDRATLLAETVRGVQSVTNNITVQAVKRADEAIRTDVVAALASDPAVEAAEVTAQVDNGVVNLAGKVQSNAERDLAIRLAKGVKGVTTVTSRIEVNYQDARADSEIAADVRRILESDVWVNESFINAAVKDGKVTLTGSVGSAAQKARARNVAWVAGVKEVDAYGLKVEGWLANDIRKAQPGWKPTNETLQLTIQESLKRNPAVNASNVEVAVANGTVTLTGIVDRLQAKISAAQEAESVAGVRRVQNLIKVRPGKIPTDSELQKSVSDAFERDPYLDSYEITVRALNGWVTLAGTVDSSFEKTHALDLVQRQAGVIAVNNNLAVQNPTLTYFPTFYPPYSYAGYYRPIQRNQMMDVEIATDIKDELAWSPFVDADEVSVAVKNQVATLTGTVDSWAEFRAAEENAYEGGAASVENKLKVE